MCMYSAETNFSAGLMLIVNCCKLGGPLKNSFPVLFSTGQYWIGSTQAESYPQVWLMFDKIWSQHEVSVDVE